MWETRSLRFPRKKGNPLLVFWGIFLLPSFPPSLRFLTNPCRSALALVKSIVKVLQATMAAGDVLYFVRPKWLVSRIRLYVAALQHGVTRRDRNGPKEQVGIGTGLIADGVGASQKEPGISQYAICFQQ